MTNEEIVREWADACAQHTAKMITDLDLYLRGSLLMSAAKQSGIKEMYEVANEIIRGDRCIDDGATNKDTKLGKLLKHKFGPS